MWLGELKINEIVKTDSPLTQYIYDVNCIRNFEAEKIMQISLDKKSFRNMPLETQYFACDVHGTPVLVANGGLEFNSSGVIYGLHTQGPNG